jgi:S-formylglutathione hydrolase FrmB
MRALPSAAAELLEEATKKFPDRLDIWCGLAFTFQEMGNFDSELTYYNNNSNQEDVDSAVTYDHSYDALRYLLERRKTYSLPGAPARAVGCYCRRGQ